MYFKGEIYNSLSFSDSGVDAEAVRIAYQKYGVQGFAKLRGAFAAAFEVGGKTILVRDQFGTIPFYYHHDKLNGIVRYSVSVKELLNSGVPRKLSKPGLATFLAYGCLMHPWTMIDGVLSVLPGTCLIYDKTSNTIDSHEYWRPDFATKQWNLDDLQNEVTSRLLKSLERQLNKGGNPAAFLSGGIDSSAIVALWRKLDPGGEIRSYCVTSDFAPYDERSWAKKVAERNRTEHRELMVTKTDVCSHIEEAIQGYDQPSVDGLNFWYACRRLHDFGENVMLSGEAGDELFFSAMGKQVYAHNVERFVRWMPSCVGRCVERLAINEKMRKLGQLIGADVPTFFITRRIISQSRIENIIKPGLLDLEALSNPYIDIGRGETDLFNYISWMDIRNFGADMYQRDGYQTTIQHDISMRMPLYDVDLAELLYSVPGEMKYSVVCPKHLLVNACADGIPQECAYREKMGFSLPFGQYLSDFLVEELKLFLRSGNSLLFNSVKLSEIGRAFCKGKVYWSNIWILYMAERWCEINKVEI